MSLLDDVSIVVTPNGYKAGTLYGVIPVPTEGADLVTDGDFSSGTNWYEGTGCTISGGKAIWTSAPSGSGFTGNNLNAGICSIGKRYTVVFTIDSISLGALKIRKPFNSSTTYTQTGTYTETFIATDVDIYIQNSGTTTASISNISVKEYTASDMDVTRATAATRVDENGLVNYAEVLGSEQITNGGFDTSIAIGTNGSGWAKVIAGSCTVEYDNGGVKLTQASVGNQDCKIYARTVGGSDNLLTVGKRYKVTYEVLSNNNSTDLKYYRGGTYLQIDHTVGTHTFYYEQESNQLSVFWNITANSDITLDNVSVKEADLNNVPRIDYTGGGCPHILAEPQSTNLITESEDFSGYSQVTGSITPNSTTSPDGTLNGSVFNALVGLATFYARWTATLGLSYAQSMFLKKGTRNWVTFVKSGGSGFAAWFDLENGVIGTVASGFSAKMENYGNGWYRCSVISNATNTLPFFQIVVVDDNNATTNSVAGSIFMWGTQAEQSAYPTSYIPTSGSTVTRNADLFTRDGIGSLINSTEGVLFAEIKSFISLDAVDQNRYIALTDGTSNERVSLSLGGNNNQLRAIIFSSSQSINLSFSITSTQTTQFNKLAIKYKSGDYAFFLNGTKINSSSETNIFATNTLNNFNLDVGGGTQQFRGMIKQLQVYKTALTDMQLIQLTGTAGTDFYESYSEMAETLTYTIQ